MPIAGVGGGPVAGSYHGMLEEVIKYAREGKAGIHFYLVPLRHCLFSRNVHVGNERELASQGGGSRRFPSPNNKIMSGRGRGRGRGGGRGGRGGGPISASQQYFMASATEAGIDIRNMQRAGLGGVGSVFPDLELHSSGERCTLTNLMVVVVVVAKL